MEGFTSNLGAINAARKQFGKNWKEHVVIEKVDGKFYAQHLQLASSAPVAGAAEAAKGTSVSIIGQAEALAADGSIEAGERENEIADNGAIVADKTEELAAAQAQADAIANAQASEQQLPNGKVWIKLSSIPKPTKQVWHIADEMLAAAAAAGQPAPARKAVQDECVRRGIASGTARTQYQAWKKARDESAANASAALAASARFNK